jgi:hypothetical protein
MVDGQGQAAPAGPFKWHARPGARLRRWLSTEAFDFADAEHDAYGRLQDPVRHRRRVVFMKPKYWVIVDDLEGTAEHQVELCFQFAPMEVTVDPDLWARARGTGGSALLIRPFATAAVTAKIHEGEVAPIRGCVSPNYGQREPAPSLVYTTESRLPLRIVTLLFPLQDPLAPPPTVSPGVRDEAGPLSLRLTDLRECVRLDQDGPVIERE